MLLLLFKVNDQRYAMNAGRIVEILPFLEIRELSKGPDYINGVVNWRGTPVPVIDLCHIFYQKRCELLISSRIILIEYPQNSLQRKTVGLLAENVTETIKSPSDWKPPQLKDPHSNVYIESTVIDKGELIKWFVPEVLLPQELTDFLFREF